MIINKVYVVALIPKSMVYGLWNNHIKPAVPNVYILNVFLGLLPYY